MPLVIIALVIFAGAAQRWWVAAHPIGTLSSDGAMVGLMALQLLHHGQLTAYTWGVAYGGSLEPVATAAVFLIAGTGTAQLLATTALTSALCALALWRAGRQIVGEQAALVGALAFWVWPATFIWRALKPSGTYMVGLALALCAVGALAKLKNGDRTWRRAAIAGLWCGLALWSSPQALLLLAPAGLWCLRDIVALRWRLLAMAAGGIVGLLPALVFGVTHDWANLHMPGRGDVLSGFLTRLGQFFTTEGPIALGVREEGSLAWLGGAVVGQALTWIGAAALLATGIAVVRGRAPRLRLPMLTIALLPFLYALNSEADHIGQGRYVMFALPMAALLIGVGVAPSPFGHWRVAAPVGLALACALGTAGLLAEPRNELVAFAAPDVAMPVNDGGLRQLLAEHGITHAYANYWIAYRVTFETADRVTVTRDDGPDPPLSAAVAASKDPAYLFVAGSRTVSAFEHWCQATGIGYQAWSNGGFTVVRPAASVSPGELPPGTIH